MRPYFAYGANMNAAAFHRRCPTARFRGTARLGAHCFSITRSGYASALWQKNAELHGILWSVSPRDLRLLDEFEEVAAGLYHRVRLPVEVGHAHKRVAALVYLARDRRRGRPRRGYVEPILAAARSHGFSLAACTEIARWLR